ncbi:MAG TPA: S24 family peptidase, partial [Rhodothermales bacterium]|nr:S24 family peptidase [Rhodothermales bacterium]
TPAADAPDPRLLQDVVLVPRIARGRAADLLRSGGYINPAQGEIEGYDVFSRSEAQRLSGVNPDDLRTVTVVGDSLVPEIFPGTRVVYVPHGRIEDFGLYVILVDDGVLVKRVQRYAGGAVEIIPINPAYCKEMLFPLQDADTSDLYRSQQTGLTTHFRVIGKVVFYLKRA